MSIRSASFLTLCLALAAGAADNLLNNADFEAVDERGVPTGWRFSGGGGPVTGEIAHGGKVAVRVRFEDRAEQRVVAEEGRWYAVSGFCRAEDRETREIPRVKLYFLSAGGERIKTGGGYIHDVTADGWTAFEIPFSTPPGTAHLGVSLIGQYGGQDWFLFDDVDLVAIESRSEPSWADTPALDGRTVEVADRADVRSYALYRIPPNSLTPIDGHLTTRAWTGRSTHIRRRPESCDFELELARPTRVSWVLIHCLNPLRKLGRASLKAAGATIEIEPSERFVHSLSLPAVETARVDLRVHGNDRRSAEVNEIQVFGIRDGTAVGGRRVELPLGTGVAEADRAILAERFAGDANRTALAAAPDAEPGQPLTVGPGRTLSIVVHPADDPVGVRGLTLSLALEPSAAQQVFELAVKECAELDLDLVAAERHDRDQTAPLSRRHADVCRVYTRPPTGGGPLTVGLDIPDTQLAADEGLWVEVRSAEAFGLDPARSRVTVGVCSPAVARAEYLPRLERLMRRLYSRLTEAHPYDGRPYQNMMLHRMVERVLAEDPNNLPATRILCRIARRLPLLDIPRPGPAEAPDWAVWGRHVQREWYRIMRWWIDNRWVESGEIGGDLNDDVEYSCHWPLSYLITGDDRVRTALRGIADAVWEQSGESGYSIVATDVEHAAEDSSCSLPQMLLCEYGSPVHIERMMKMSLYIPFWTGLNERGRRHFKSYIFNATMVSDQPRQDIDHLYCALAMIGPTHLTWYNDHPRTRKWVAEYARSWSEAAMSTAKGKPKGALPCDIRYSTGEIAPYTERWNKSVYYSFGQYVMRYFLQGARRLGVDAGPSLQPAVALIEGPDRQAIERARAALERFAAPPPPAAPGLAYAADRTWRSPAGSELDCYRASVATGDKRYLVGLLEELAREMERTRWLLTEAEPFTDRVPVPAATLLRYMFLGGDVAGKTHVPGLAASWEGGGTDFAALVLDAGDDRLKALVYGFADGPLAMALRVWRLRPGRYEVKLGYDGDGDDRIDSLVATERVHLQRYRRVPFELPPGRTLVIEARLLEPDSPGGPLPDLAISPEDLRVDGGGWSLTVHNVGAADAPAAIARVLDAGGAALASAPVPAIAAPLDLLPKTAEVRLPRRPEGRRIEIEMRGRSEEIETVNNAVALP